MKKKYEKPAIVFDSFELSQSIAGGCMGIMQNFSQETQCPVLIDYPGWGQMTIFARETGCSLTSDRDRNSICYDVPMDNTRVFTS